MEVIRQGTKYCEMLKGDAARKNLKYNVKAKEKVLAARN